MKTYMREEHQQLDAVGALTVQDSLNHVELLRLLQSHQEALASCLETQLQADLMQTLTQLGGQLNQTQEPLVPAATLQVNAVQQTTAHDALLQALQRLTQQVQALRIEPTPPNPNDGMPHTNPRTG